MVVAVIYVTLSRCVRSQPVGGVVAGGPKKEKGVGMAHSPQIKGAALARLVTGETPGAVARATGVPYATVKRWQGEALGRNGHQKKDGADLLGSRVGGYLGESLVTG